MSKDPNFVSRQGTIPQITKGLDLPDGRGRRTVFIKFPEPPYNSKLTKRAKSRDE